MHEKRGRLPISKKGYINNILMLRNVYSADMLCRRLQECWLTIRLYDKTHFNGYRSIYHPLARMRTEKCITYTQI